MKTFSLLIFTFFIFCSILYCNESIITFEVISDQNINCNDDYLTENIISNCLVAKSNGKILDRFYSANVNILEIESINNNLLIVKYKRNENNQTPSAPFWNSGKIFLNFKNGKFIQVFKYPEKKGSQEGPVLKLLNADIKNDFIKLKYDYQQYGDARAAGFGTTELLFNKLDNVIYYFSDYEFNVYGHFAKAIGYYSSDDKEGHEAWVPDEDGEKIVKKDVSKIELARQFAELLTDIWYDSTELNAILYVSENLRLRETEKTSSKIITTMKARTEVKVLKIGTAEMIDGFPGNWCFVEIVENIYKKNEEYDFFELAEKSKPTGVKGWCFSAYLK